MSMGAETKIKSNHITCCFTPLTTNRDWVAEVRRKVATHTSSRQLGRLDVVQCSLLWSRTSDEGGDDVQPPTLGWLSHPVELGGYGFHLDLHVPSSPIPPCNAGIQIKSERPLHPVRTFLGLHISSILYRSSSASTHVPSLQYFCIK